MKPQVPNHNPTLKNPRWLCTCQPRRPSICASHSPSLSPTPSPITLLPPTPVQPQHSTTPAVTQWRRRHLRSCCFLPFLCRHSFLGLRALQKFQHHTHLHHHFLQEASSDAPRVHAALTPPSAKGTLWMSPSFHAAHLASEIIAGTCHLLNVCLLNPQNGNTRSSPSSGEEKH